VRQFFASFPPPNYLLRGRRVESGRTCDLNHRLAALAKRWFNHRTGEILVSSSERTLGQSLGWGAKKAEQRRAPGRG
jgi:hypothetical protein